MSARSRSADVESAPSVESGHVAYVLDFVRLDEFDKRGASYSESHEQNTYLLHVQGGRHRPLVSGWSSIGQLDLAEQMAGLDSEAHRQRIGDQLRTWLLSAGWGRYEAEIENILQRGQSVSLTIRSAAREVHALPWELLTFDATGQHLGELEHVHIGYAWPDTRPVSKSRTSVAGRWLMAWSSAGSAVPVHGHRQALASASQLADGGQRMTFDPERDVLGQASCHRLEQTLAAAARQGHPFSGLHILCHGQGGGLVLTAPGDQADERVSALQMRQVLAPYRQQLRLVMLCACDNRAQEQAGAYVDSVALSLHRLGIQWVISARYALSKKGATSFAHEFYRRLADRPTNVHQAFTRARNRLLLYQHIRDWSSLQLFVRPRVR